MAYLLSIECTTAVLSVALFKNHKFIAEIFREPKDGRGHAEILLPTIDQLFNQHKIVMDQITALALSVGPGSFTSIRVGIATAMGLCLGRDLPVYAVSTLKALALGYDGNAKFIAPVLRAGRGHIYGAILEKDSLHEVYPEAILSPQDFAREVASHTNIASFGTVTVETVTVGTATEFFAMPLTYPRARHVGELAIRSGQPISAKNLRPRYLQQPALG